MPIEIDKQATSTSAGPNGSQTTQTATSAQVPTNLEHRDAQTNRGNAWVWYIVGVIDLLLFLRILFHLFGARTVGFAEFLYGITSPLIAPFRGIFANPKIDSSYFDLAALTAIVVYIILAWIISGLISLATRPADSKNT
jgi:uncharacterized protein YggT (Ycf19 family)